MFQSANTLILVFSKVVQFLTSLLLSLGSRKQNPRCSTIQEGFQITLRTKENLLNSITEIHYIDVGLNTAGAHITDSNPIEKISKLLMEGDRTIRFVLHGTRRQWRDSRRVWIRKEKDKLILLLEFESGKTGGKL